MTTALISMLNLRVEGYKYTFIFISSVPREQSDEFA